MKKNLPRGFEAGNFFLPFLGGMAFHVPSHDGGTPEAIPLFDVRSVHKKLGSDGKLTPPLIEYDVFRALFTLFMYRVTW